MSADGKSRLCRLVTEVRAGNDISVAAAWIGKRVALGRESVAGDAPQLNYRQDDDGSVWLSFALQSGVPPMEQIAGGSMGGPLVELVTFRPFGDHGCIWHVDGSEVDSSGRRQSSPTQRMAYATLAHATSPID